MRKKKPFQHGLWLWVAEARKKSLQREIVRLENEEKKLLQQRHELEGYLHSHVESQSREIKSTYYRTTQTRLDLDKRQTIEEQEKTIQTFKESARKLFTQVSSQVDMLKSLAHKHEMQERRILSEAEQKQLEELYRLGLWRRQSTS